MQQQQRYAQKLWTSKLAGIRSPSSLSPRPLSEDEKRFIVAAKEGDVSTLKHLLDSGVDVNCRHPLGWTALHTAVINGHKRYTTTNFMSTLQ